MRFGNYLCVKFPPPSIVTSNVPEAALYDLVYALDIPTASNWDTTAQVPYSINNAAALSIYPFTRVAYFLQLDSTWIWVSFDAFTTNLNNIGIPADYVAQQKVTNMNVFSNSISVTTGTAIQTGNIEFWCNGYSPTAGNALIPTGNNVFF